MLSEGGRDLLMRKLHKEKPKKRMYERKSAALLV